MSKKTQKTVTRSDIANAIIEEFQITKYTALEIIEDIIEEITLALSEGENVKIAGFGSFVVKDKNERIGRNPRTKEEALICKRKAISFKASPVLKELVNFKGNNEENQ